MSNYRRLISYIYAYEGGVKGKNIGFAKIETRGVQCKITVSVKKIYVGGNDIGVYLLAGEEEIFLGNIFIRGGSGEFRTVVTVSDVEHSGISMEECCGLTVHDVDNTWRSYTTIWEDAVAHAAEVELGETLLNRKEAGEEVREARIKKAVREIEEEFPLEPSAGSVHSYIGNHVPAVEFSEELAPEVKTGSGEVQVEMEQENVMQRTEPDAAEEESTEIETEASEASTTATCEREEMPEEIREPEKTERPERIEEPDYADSQREIREPDRRLQQSTSWNGLDTGRNVHYYQSVGREAGADVSVPENVPDNIAGYQADTVWNQGTSYQCNYGEYENNLAYQNDYNEAMETMYRIDSGQEPDYAQPQESAVEWQVDQPVSQPMGSPVYPQSDWNDPAPVAPLAREENNHETAPVIAEAETDKKQPVPGNPDELERLRRLEEEEENSQDLIWEKLSRERAKIFAFDYEKGCEILTIKPQDIGLLPREIWVYGNNSFLLHGYYNYRYLILAKLNNPQGTPRYLLGVPGHYYSNELYMASMFGFPEFVLSKDQPAGDGRFGYWYTDIKIDQ